MRFPIRKIFAVLLFAGALVPVAMVSLNDADPIDNLVFWVHAGELVTRVGFYAAFGAGAAALIYPPAIPLLKLRFTQAWRRLGTDRGPLYEGIARLRHLETHDERLKVGRTARQLGETQLAVENLYRAYELDPTHTTGRYQLALVMAEIGRFEDAANLLLALVHDDEKHAFGDALFQLGKALFRMHRDPEAVAVLRRHQQLFPGSRQAHLLLARALAETNAMDAAREQLAAARRPVSGDERLSPEEALARARAKVTFLRAGTSAQDSQSGEQDA